MIAWTDVESTGLNEREGHLLEVAMVVTDDDLNEVSHFSTVVQPVGVSIDQIPMDQVVRDMHEKNGLFAELRAGKGMRRFEAEEKLIEWLTVPPLPPSAEPQCLFRGELVMAPYESGEFGKLAGMVDLDHCVNCKKKAAEHVSGPPGLPPTTFTAKRVTLASQTPLAGSTVSFDRRWLKEHMPKLEALFSYRSIDVSSITELARRWSPTRYEQRPKEENKPHRALLDIRASIELLRYWRRVGFVGGQ